MFTQCFSNNIYKGSQVPLKCSRQTSIPRKWISSEGWASVIFQLVKISNNLFQFSPSPGNMKSGTLLAQSSSPGVNGSRDSKANFIVDVYNKLSWRLDDLSPISFWVDTLSYLLTSLKSLRLRKKLDLSALAYLALLGSSWPYWTLLDLT